MNIYEAILEGKEQLKDSNIKSYGIDTEILMAETLKKARDYIILNHKKNLDKDDFRYFKKLIDKRSKGEPVAYIINKKDFWKTEFFVTNDVLIPRPDTELIVEQVLKMTENRSKLNILEIGIGSGCILLSILNERKSFIGTGIDISKKSIEICRVNVNKLNLNNRIKLFKSDIDNFSNGKYDLIISNPPYIKKNDLKYLDKDIVKFEPDLALNGGFDGLSEIKKIINRSSDLIKINGILVLEIAFNQKKEVIRLLNKNRLYVTNVFKDLAKNDRCIISRKLWKKFKDRYGNF